MSKNSKHKHEHSDAVDNDVEQLLEHIHSHSHAAVPVSEKHSKILFYSTLGVVFLTLAAIFLTFPASKDLNKEIKKVRKALDFPIDQYAAKVNYIKTAACDGQEEIATSEQVECKYVYIDVPNRTLNSQEGRPCLDENGDGITPIRYCAVQTFYPDQKSYPNFQRGDKVIVSYRNDKLMDVASHYTYADQDRRGVMFALIALFIFAVFLFGYWRGLLAVVGLFFSLVVIVMYILPALLAGENGLVVALAGGTAVAFVALYLAHGFNSSTHIAFLSSIGTVFSIAFLAQLFFAVGNFTGLISEEANYLGVAGVDIDMSGLLVAGVILASLGALDDMTVTQVSAVSEMHMARPDYKFVHLWKSALRIGRDHVASTVNTLALAYVGSSIAVMIIFVISELSSVWIINSEAIAADIVGALVGSIGLIISVPLSTAIAAYVVHHSGEETKESARD